jgi:predicted dehydrogenase
MGKRNELRLGVLGCGFVSEYYLGAISTYENLTVAGVFDAKAERVRLAQDLFGVPKFASYEEMLRSREVDVIVNLTTPDAHFETSRAALLAGKHLYTEKPMTLDMPSAAELVELAQAKGLLFCAAPSTLLGPTAQTLWHAVRNGRVGKPKVVYAEMDDGAVHLKNHRGWRGRMGLPWPHMSEFATGCTMEHAAYYLSWLTTFFGPARRVTAVAHCVYPDKRSDAPIPDMAPDFTVGCIEFADGTLGRITCGLVAPANHTLMIVGDGGVLTIEDCWDINSKILLRSATGEPGRHLSPAEEYPLLRAASGVGYEAAHTIDFAAGLDDMARALRGGPPPRLSAAHALHVHEVTLALQKAGRGHSVEIRSRFAPPAPMPWAQ